MGDRIVSGPGGGKNFHSSEKEASAACKRIKRNELFSTVASNTKVLQGGVGDIAHTSVFQGAFNLSLYIYVHST